MPGREAERKDPYRASEKSKAIQEAIAFSAESMGFHSRFQLVFRDIRLYTDRVLGCL
jgi:hypothetical protein